MTRHIRGLDTLRLVALFAVVWIHASDTNPLASHLTKLWADFAVPSFLLMSIYLTMTSLSKSPEVGFGAFMQRRLARLGPAYLAWTVLYLLFRVAKHAVAAKQPLVVDWVATLFCGAAAYHLWYIPALLYLTALFFPLFRAARDRAGPLAAGLCLVLAVVMIGAYQLADERTTVALGVPSFLLHYMLRCGACVPLAVALWMMEREPLQWLRPRTGPWVPVLAVGLWAVAVAVHALPHTTLAYAYLLALGAFLLSLALPRTDQPGPKWLTESSALTFGVYLMHGMFVEGLQVVAGMAHVSLASFPATTAVVVAAYALSLLGAALLGRLQACRWLVRLG